MKRPILILALLTAAISCHAQDRPRSKSPFDGLLAPPEHLLNARAELQLSDEQTAQLRAVHEQHHPAFRAKAEAVAEAHKALREALSVHPVKAEDAARTFEALLRAEAETKQVEFAALLQARNVLTAEQFAKMRQHAAADGDAKPPREAEVKAKLERLKSLIKKRESEGNPPREHEAAIRELEKAVREKDVKHANQLVDQLLKALGGSPGASVDKPGEPGLGALREQLAAAQAREDEPAVLALCAQMMPQPGDRLGEPEAETKFHPAAEGASALDPAKLQDAFAPMLAEIERVKWWRVGLDPAQLRQFPRTVGSVITGCLAARRAGCGDADKLLATAREAGDFLLWTQAQAGTGQFPFPTPRGGTEGVMAIAERVLHRAEAEGRLDQMVRNGWAIEDMGDDGGLQIENAVCALGILDLYEATRDERYLRSARAAGDWAITRRCVPNWNYNSFSVCLLAELHRVTGDARFLDAAKKKTRLGVLPGQIPVGPRAGRWADPHNAKPNYHYILTRSLACLAAQLPAADADRPRVLTALGSALRAWNPAFEKEGAPNISSAGEALALLELRLPNHAELLGETATVGALATLERVTSTTLASGGRPADPSTWGLLLEAAARRAQARR